MVKRIYGTHYGEPGLFLGNIKDIPKGYFNGFYPFKQTIYFNPMSSSGNFKFRSRIWFWNQHVPASNTGGDFVGKILVDYEGNGDIWEYDWETDRTTGAYDYSKIVNEWYDKCEEEFNKGELSEREFYEKLYSFKVEVTIWIATKERIISIYPDDLESLHEQSISGKLGHDREDLKMNVIFPKLTEVSDDIFYNYTKLGTHVFYGCDRLRWVPENLFDTLTEQTTLESWFENSAIINIPNNLFEPLTELTNIDYVFKNSQLRTVEDRLFYNAPKIVSCIGSFENCKRLTKVGVEVIRQQLRYPVKEITYVNMFAGCGNLFLPLDTKIKDILYTNYNTKVHTYNMLGGVYVYNSDEELLEEIPYWDKQPTNAIYISEPSEDITGLNCLTLTYTAKDYVPINSIRLVRAAGPNRVEEVTNTSMLKGRIVIEADGIVNGWDPALRPTPIPEINIGNWEWHEGEVQIIKIYSEDVGDLFGIHLNLLDIDGRENPYIIEDKVSLSINGALPRTETPTRMVLLFNQLQKIETTDIFFKNYDKYDVEGLFYGLYWLDLNNDYQLFRPLVNQTTFKNCFKDNKVFNTVNNMLATNTKITSVEGMFDGCSELIQFQMRLLDSNRELRSAKNMFRNCSKLAVNEFAVNLLKNNVKLETISGMFDNCVLLNRRQNIDHLINCVDFSFMYRNCEKLDLTDISITEVDWNSSDLMTKFGKLSDIKLLPNWDDTTRDINLESMFEGCVLTKVYRHILYGKEKKNLRINIKNMFKGLHSPFTDLYLFKDLYVQGESGIITDIPEQVITVNLKSFELRLNHMLRHYGSVKVGTNNALATASIENNVFYPEYVGSFDIDWGDGNTETITFNPRSRLRNSGRIEASRAYLDDANGIDGVSVADLDIEYYTKELDNITHRYDQSYIGQDIKIRIKNRFIPLTVKYGGDIVDYDGLLPWGRIELLDFSSWNQITTLHKGLFDWMFLSTNTGLRNYSNKLETESIQYSMFNEFNELTTVEEDVFTPLANISVLGPVFTNCNKIIEMQSQLFAAMKNCYSAEFTFFGCSELRMTAALPGSIRVLYATHAYTNVLSALWNVIGELPELLRACEVFSGCKSERNRVDFAPFANSPKLRSIAYIYRNAEIYEFPDYIFRTNYALEVAIGVFAGTNVQTWRFNPFPNARNLRIIDELFMGSEDLMSYDAGDIGDGEIVSANYVFKDCPKLKSVNENMLKYNRDLSTVKGFFENCSGLKSVQNVLFTMRNIKVVDRMYSGCESINSIPSDYFESNPNIVSAEYLFSKTGFETMPENIFSTFERLESMEGLFKDCKKLKNIRHLGLKVDSVGSGFNMKYLFKGCEKLDWMYHKFPDIISPKVENSLPLILIQGCLHSIEAKYSDNELADGKFTIVGLSESLYRPDASTDTFNMNKFTMMIHLDKPYTTAWKNFSYNLKVGMQPMNEILDLVKTNRVVIDIDGKVYGFDKRIQPDADLPRVELGVGDHIISIYTEGINEVVNDDTINSDLVILDVPAGVPITLRDNMPVGYQDNKDNNEIRALKLIDIFGEDCNIVDIYDCNFKVLNGKNSWLPKKYFTGLNFNRVNLDNLPLRLAYCASMFENCRNLITVTATKPVNSGIVEPPDLSKMFKGCTKLKNLPNFAISDLFPAVDKLATKYTIRLPINYESMFEDCSSLTKAPQVINFEYKAVRTIQFSIVKTELESRITLSKMFKGCTGITELQSGIVNDKSNAYPNTYPTYNMTSMFENCGGIIKIRARVFQYGSVSNASTWSKCFQNCVNLETIYKPLMSLSFKNVYLEIENNMEVGYMLGSCTKLSWERTRMRTVVEFPDATGKPNRFSSYGMLENVISYLKDEEIFKDLRFSGATLAIYEDHGPSTNGMNRLTIYYDVKKQYDGQSWQFRLWGPTSTDSGYQDVTGLNSKSLNGRVVLVFNDKNGSEDAIEYSAEEPTNIKTHRVLEPEEPYADLPDVDGYKQVRLKIDIYTDKKLEDFTMYEFLGTMKPTRYSEVTNIILDGTLGRSDKFSAKGLMLTEIFGLDASELITQIGGALLEQNPNIEPIKDEKDGLEYYKCVFSGMTKIKNIPDGILQGKENTTKLWGLFADTALDSIPNNMFKDTPKLNDVQYLFAFSKLPRGVDKTLFKHLNNCTKFNYNFYKCTGLANFDISELFSGMSGLKEAKYLFYKSDLSNVHIDTFRFNTLLEDVEGIFSGTNINSVPTMFQYNKNLRIASYSFEATKITKTPDRLFADMPNLQMVVGAFRDCTGLGTITDSIFAGSPNILDASETFKGCTILRKIPVVIFNEFRRCLHIDGIFEGCEIVEKLEPILMDNFVSVETASRIFKDCIRIPIIPDNFLHSLVNCTTLANAFSGIGALGHVGNAILPENNALEDATEMFKGQFNLTVLPSDIFKFSPKLKYTIGTFEGLTGLEELPKDIIKNNPKVEDISRMFKQTAITEVPKDYFVSNTKIKNAVGTFASCGNIKRLGKPFINLNDEYTEFDFRECFYNCINLGLHYDKIGKFIKGIEKVVDPVSIKVESMFSGVKTFLDEVRVWEGVNKIGNSRLTTTPAPSTDTTGLNVVGVIITPRTDNMNTTYKLIDLAYKFGVVTTAADFKGRVVIEVDNTKKAYDPKIYEDEEIADIILPSNNTQHTIKIYTESNQDLLWISGLYKEFSNNDTEDDINIWLRSQSPSVEVIGSFNERMSVTTGYTLSSMNKLYVNASKKLVVYPIVKIDSRIISKLEALPRITEDPKGGFFSGLSITEIPSKIIKRDLIVRNTSFEATVGLFANCKKLSTVPTDLLSNMHKVTDLSYMFYGCDMLDNIPRFISLERPINKMDYMFADCISLKTIANDFFSQMALTLTITGMFKGTRALTKLHDNIFKTSATITRGDELFMNSGLTLIPPSLQVYGEFMSNIQRMFKGSKIAKIPDGFFDKMKYLSGTIEPNYSSIEETFADIPTLTTIEGSLGLTGSVKNIKGLFTNCENLVWKNHLVARFLYVSYPNECYVQDSFKNVHVNWDNNTQLFTPIRFSGESNAIFDGRLIPGTGTDGLKDLTVTVDASNLNDKPTTEVYLWRWGIPGQSLLNETKAQVIQTEPSSVSLIASTDLKNRIVIRVTELNNTDVISEIGYDSNIEEAFVDPLIIPTDRKVNIHIFTDIDYVGIKGKDFKSIEIKGVLPADAYINDEVIPLYKMFGDTTKNCHIRVIGGTLLDDSGKTKLNLDNTPFKSEMLEEVGEGLFKTLVDQEELIGQFSGSPNLTKVPTNIFEGLTKLVKCREIFKNCEKLDMNLDGIFRTNTELKDITGIFSHSGLTTIPEGIFDNLLELYTIAYAFEYTKITSIPDKLMKFNKQLLSVASAFRDTKITSIPLLHLNPGCYELGRVFFNCTYLESPYRLTIVNGLYNGTQPLDTVSLLDCFYNVPVRFDNEGQFVEGIRFMTGATGANFLKTYYRFNEKKVHDSQIGNILKSWGYNMKEVTIECNGFIPTLPDNTTYKTSFKEIIINGIKPQPLSALGWRQQWDEAPRITCEACTGISGWFYQSGYKRIDRHFWDGLPNVKYYIQGAWWGPNIEKIFDNSDWLEGAPKSLIRIELSSQEGSPSLVKSKWIKPVAKQLQKFTASGYATPNFEEGFWEMFDWSKFKSLAGWPGHIGNKYHIPDDLIKCLKSISQERVIFIEHEYTDLTNIPDGRINLYNSFRYDMRDKFDNFDEIPEYMITTEEILNQK